MFFLGSNSKKQVKKPIHRQPGVSEKGLNLLNSIFDDVSKQKSSLFYHCFENLVCFPSVFLL